MTESKCLPNAPTQNRSPEYRLPPDSTIGATIESFPFLASPPTEFRFLSASHERRTRTLKGDRYWLLY